MRTKIVLTTLLWAGMLAKAAAPHFGLGFDYSQWLVATPQTMVIDASGAIYVLNARALPGPNAPASSVIKLSANGQTLVWQNQLAFAVGAMAVDPSGGVYVTPVNADGSVTVAKLNDGGSGIARTSPILMTQPNGSPTGYYVPTIAVDTAGRTYVTGYWQTVPSGSHVVRLAANGTTIEYSTPILGRPNSIAVDATGAAVVAGVSTSDGRGFAARFAPDGTPGFNVSVPDSGGQRVLLDANGNAVTDSNGTLTRLDANGHVVSSITVGQPAFSSFTLDNAGNAYVMGSSRTRYYQAKYSLVPCGTEFLSVIAPDGSVLQTTYLPDTAFNTVPPIVLGKDGMC